MTTKKIFSKALSAIFILVFSAASFQTALAQIVIDNPLEADTLADVVAAIAGFIFIIGVAIVPVMVLLGAFYLMTSAGDPAKVKKGRDCIMWAAIGLAIILLAKGISYTIQFLLGGPASSV